MSPAIQKPFLIIFNSLLHWSPMSYSQNYIYMFTNVNCQQKVAKNTESNNCNHGKAKQKKWILVQELKKNITVLKTFDFWRRFFLSMVQASQQLLKQLDCFPPQWSQIMIKVGGESGKPRAQMFSLSSCSTHPPTTPITTTTTRPPISALERQIQPHLFGHLHPCKKKKKKKKVPAQVFPSN